jgi:hypothetical protein
MKRLLYLLLPCVLPLALAGCPTGNDDDSTPEPTPCENDGPPAVAVLAIEDGQAVGFPVEVGAQVTDGDGISTVTLWYRQANSPAPWQNIFLAQVEEQPEFWIGSIPGVGVTDPGVDWYVVAKDVDDGCQEEATEPVGAPEQFFTFTTQLDLTPVPYTTDFELGGEDCGTEDVSQLGWTAGIEGFPQETHGWRLRPQSPLSGRCSASHSEGIPFLWDCPPPEGEGTINRKNWLISPPLDMRGKDDIAVRWFEKRVASGDCPEVHSLYVSTGSPDPEIGDYQLLADLPLPSTSWASSEWFDLTEYAGSDRLYVALYYEAGAASRWQIDDFYVGEPLADLTLDSTSGLDSSVGPGSNGVTLDVTLINNSDLYGASNLTATLTTADDQLSLVTAEATYASLEPGATEVGSTPFVFDVASTHPDNAYLDFALVVEDDAEHTWTVPIRLLMGEESAVRVDWTAAGPASLTMELGYGFPANPDFTFATDTDDQTSGFWQFTITEHAAALPPGPGSRRWFLRALNPTGFPASLDAVEFTVGGESFTAATLDAAPLDVPPEGEVLIRIPEPPRFEVASMDTVPDPVAPGTTVRIESLELLNVGSATSGAVSCAMGTAHPHVSNVDPTPTTFGTSVIGAGETETADGDFTFDLDAAHVDNSPVELSLLCLDGVETLESTFSIDVPYAHPIEAGFVIDDTCAACNDNGYIDAGEQVEVRLIATNDGAFDTGGALTATVSVGTGSTADFTMSSPSTVSFGTEVLAVGETRTSVDTFTVVLGPDAEMGDSIVLDIEFASAGDLWSDDGLLEAVGLDWLPCPWDDDPEGDVVGSGTIDIKNCSYRSDTDLVQIRMESYTDFDPATAFVDFFIYETPELYVVESVGGNPDFEIGCVFPDTPLLDPDEEFTSEPRIDFTSNTATLRFALPDISALGNNIQVAFGAGSCPGDYFCDLYPGLPALYFDLLNAQASCDGAEFIPINWLPVF